MIQMDYVAASKVMLQVGTAVGLAVVVERIVEFSKNALDLLPLTSTGQKLQSAARINEIIAAAQAASKPLPEAEDGEADSDVRPVNVLVAPATDADDGSTLRAFILQLIAAAVGIGVAMFWHVHMFNALGVVKMPDAADHILTGLFIGGGSAPAHILMRFLSDRKITVPESKVVAAVAPKAVAVSEVDDEAAAPKLLTSTGESIAMPAVIIKASLDWRDIDYRPFEAERLEHLHIRKAKPNLIVFHHTAMDYSSTFQDVVNVIQKERKWITAYHCVVTGDGRTHGFCRWDRLGSHAKNYNSRSLGVSLNGCFDNDPTDPYANHKGRRGPLRPSEKQLDSAARVVALWAHLYDIPVVFNLNKQANPAPGIIPHKAVADKSCPGNMFPYAEFERLVKAYHGAWKTSSTAQQAIEAFKLKPYVYAAADRRELAVR